MNAKVVEKRNEDISKTIDHLNIMLGKVALDCKSPNFDKLMDTFLMVVDKEPCYLGPNNEVICPLSRGHQSRPTEIPMSYRVSHSLPSPVPHSSPDIGPVVSLPLGSKPPASPSSRGIVIDGSEEVISAEPTGVEGKFAKVAYLMVSAGLRNASISTHLRERLTSLGVMESSQDGKPR